MRPGHGGQLQLYNSPTHGQVWVATNVPGRSEVEVHAANWAHQLLGCLGVGDSFGTLSGLPAVLNSQHTLTKLRTTLPATFSLAISWASDPDPAATPATVT